MTKQIKTDETVKNDNLMNAATAMGIAGKARNPATSFAIPVKLSYGDLDNIYSGDGFGKIIIDIYANDMTREWIKIDGDPDNMLLKYLENIQAKRNLNYALKWSRLYGASIIVMLIDDGGQLDEPVNINTIRSVQALRVVDRTQLSIQFATDWYDDPTQLNYGSPKVYTVSPPKYTSTTTKNLTLGSYRVHESRALRFDGEIMPDSIMNANSSFGLPVLQPIYNYLRNFAQSHEYSSEILHEFIVGVLSIKNLSQIVATKNGVDNLKARAEIISYCKSVINGIMIDADGESYQKLTSPIAGLTDLIDKFGLALAAVARIPYMVLMGESPSGLNASSDNSIRAWYDSLAGEQEEILPEQLNKLLSYILEAEDNPLKGKSMDEIKIIFNSLWQYDEPTQIDMRNKQALSDQVYLQNDVVMPEEIATSRFGGDQYSFETSIDEKLRK